ncbi:Wzz/FepE/Etk N-terminal domain-containing protein, partial [Bifidobacterium angulatum]
MAEENENQESGQGISDGSRPSGITFADIVVIIRKHIATAAICFAVIVGVAGAYAFLAAPQYSATAQVIATYNAAQDGGNSDDITQQNTGGTYVSNQIKSYPTLATTETVLKPVISQLGLD